MISAGSKSIINGGLSFELLKPAPLIVFDGRAFPNITSFHKQTGHYEMTLLSKSEGITHYGADARNGVLEIKSL